LALIEYRRSSDQVVVVSVECEDYRDVMVPAVSEERIRLPFMVKATDHREDGGSITLKFQEFVLNAARKA
jgi:hypothetical protein